MNFIQNDELTFMIINESKSSLQIIAFFYELKKELKNLFSLIDISLPVNENHLVSLSLFCFQNYYRFHMISNEAFPFLKTNIVFFANHVRSVYYR